MKDLDQALSEISAIRTQLARATEFRGYGSITVAATGLIAIAAALIQARLFPGAARDVNIYIWIWGLTAVLATGLIGIETIVRSRTIHSGLAQEMVLGAAEALVPAGVAGVLLSAVLIRMAPESEWMIPGLWQIIFSLGVFASSSFLPRGVLGVAAWYLLAGLVCLWWLSTTRILSPGAMGLPFGVGQFFAAAVLRWNSDSAEAS